MILKDTLLDTKDTVDALSGTQSVKREQAASKDTDSNWCPVFDNVSVTIPGDANAN